MGFKVVKIVLVCFRDGHFDITKTRKFKYIENFTSKNWKFLDKKLWYFFIFLLKT